MRKNMQLKGKLGDEMRYHILLVEDDEDLCAIAEVTLGHAGYKVDKAYTCAKAEELMAKNQYHLILLDMMLPDSLGDELCRKIRRGCDCPIIFMSCMDGGDTIINALRSGGDDYMVKPVRYPELIARVQAVIRRSRQVREYRSFTVDTVNQRVLRDDTDVNLTHLEYALLEYMTGYPDKLLLYQELHENVWKNDSLDDYRALGVHVSNLRKKIDPDHRGIIENVRGAGYVFSDV